MLLSVLFYSDAKNPQALPVEWPAEVIELPDDSPSPKFPWVQMNEEEYDKYRAEHQHLYDKWEAEQNKNNLDESYEIESTPK